MSCPASSVVVPFLVILLPAGSAIAQVSEIPAMTVPKTVIAMQQAGPAGPTHTGTIVLAGSHGIAPIANITLTPSGAMRGTYDVNTSLGRALVLDGSTGGLRLIDPGASYDAFDARIDLTWPATELGLAIGDLRAPVSLWFYRGESLLGGLTTSEYTTADPKFFRSSQTFDRIEISAGQTANFVLPELHLQNSGPQWYPFGSSCAGTDGTPSLQALSQARLGNPFVIGANGLPRAPGLWILALGLSATSLPPYGTLPMSLAFLGAPGCYAYNDIAVQVAVFHFGVSSAHQMNIPNSPRLIGTPFYAQGYVIDPPANALGITTTNGGAVQIAQ